MTENEFNQTRIDLKIIADLVDPDSSVLDLGCGQGELLDKLIHEKSVQGHGVEIYNPFIYRCVEKGVPVIHGDLDEGLSDYPDQSFDYVILSRTLQVVKKPMLILHEMLRVGKTCILSFPNFGNWLIRAQLAFTGKMPRTKTLPYEWYDTPNIHLLTIKDFLSFCNQENIIILRRIYLGKSKKKGIITQLLPNVLSELVIFVVKKTL